MRFPYCDNMCKYNVIDMKKNEFCLDMRIILRVTWSPWVKLYFFHMCWPPMFNLTLGCWSLLCCQGLGRIDYTCSLYIIPTTTRCVLLISVRISLTAIIYEFGPNPTDFVFCNKMTKSWVLFTWTFLMHFVMIFVTHWISNKEQNVYLSRLSDSGTRFIIFSKVWSVHCFNQEHSQGVC